MLDVAKLLPDIREMVAQQGRRRTELDNAAGVARLALEGLASEDWEAISERIRALPLSHLMATFREPPHITPHSPGKPGPHTVVATDGSQIPADRHEIAFCYVLNVGTVYLPYGSSERPRLNSLPLLQFREEDLTEELDGDIRAITPRRIASRRLQLECRALATLVEEAAERGEPAVALMDGSLILWHLEAESPSVRREVLADFNALLSRARDLRIPIVGYISRPGSGDVVNSLKSLMCGLCSLKCDAGRSGPPDLPCRDLAGISDISLFNRTLERGERSALFGSQSKVLREMHESNRVLFFYLDTGKEIARVELPAWVAELPELVDRVHAVVLDQADKGLGYPRALIEAHELAVVRASERSAFFQFVQLEMAKAHVPIAGTLKQSSKRLRSI